MGYNYELQEIKAMLKFIGGKENELNIKTFLK